MRLARNIANIILTKKAIRPKQLNSIGRWDYKCVQLTFTAGVQGRRKFGNGPAEPTKLFHVFIGPNKTVKSFDCERIKYGGMVRWLKKSSNEACLTWSHMHLILKWLKIRTVHFSLFFPRNIDHVSFGRSGSLFLARKCWSGSKFESFLPRIQFLFEFWATSIFSS